ncbi:MAG: sugar-binding domain-containing protein, partial [Mucilaginibacter sp.]
MISPIEKIEIFMNSTGSAFLKKFVPFLLFIVVSISSFAQTNAVRNAGLADIKMQAVISASQLKLPRAVINFNRSWKFQVGDWPDAANPRFSDAKWQNIGLPHSFSIPYFMSPDFYVGYGWYRKHFTIPAGNQHKKIFLEFEAVFQQAEIFVNNKKVG